MYVLFESAHERSFVLALAVEGLAGSADHQDSVCGCQGRNLHQQVPLDPVEELDSAMPLGFPLVHYEHLVA